MSKQLQPSHWRTIINAICTILTTLLAGLTMSSCSAGTGLSVSSFDFINFGVINFGLINWVFFVLILLSLMLTLHHLRTKEDQ